MVVSGLWDLPQTKSENVLVKALANGWQMNGLYTYHTGFPFTPVTFQLHGIRLQLTRRDDWPGAAAGLRSGGLSTSCNNRALP